MNELKSKRSGLKMKISTSAGKLQRCIPKKEEKNICSYASELLDAYLEFEEIDLQYTSAIEADDTDELEAFKIVNGMDCNAYTQHVEEIYTAAKTSYDEYILRSANETFEKLNNKLKRLWNKIKKEINPAQIKKDLERVTDITHKLSQLVRL